MSQICDGSRNLNLLFTLPGILFLWLFSQPLPFHHKILPPQITTLSPYSKLYPIPPSPWEHTCHLVLFPPHHYSLSKNKSYLLLFLPTHTHTHTLPHVTQVSRKPISKCTPFFWINKTISPYDVTDIWEWMNEWLRTALGLGDISGLSPVLLLFTSLILGTKPFS